MAQTKASEEQWTDQENGNDNWDDVVTESQIVFDAIGDEFVGVYLGMDQTPTGIYQAHFEKDGTTYFTNAGWDLRKKLENVPVKATVRIRWESELDTGQKTPMRVFKVSTKR